MIGSPTRLLGFCAVWFCLAHAAVAWAVGEEGAAPVTGEVVRLDSGWGSDGRVRMALILRHQPGWHTYWVNPGDSGLATSIEWDLPKGFAAGEIEWPTPKKLEAAGLVSFVYEDEVVLPFTIRVPEPPPQEPVLLRGKAIWVRCTDGLCEAGGMEFEIELGPNLAANPRAAGLLERIDAAKPRPLPEGVTARWSRSGSEFTLEIKGVEGLPGISDFFPIPPGGVVIEKIEGPFEEAGGTRFRIETAAAPAAVEAIGGLLIAGSPPVGYEIAGGVAPAEPNAVDDSAPEAGEGKGGAFDTFGTGRVTSVWQAIVFGILGGLILNLMPCVLPAISLKLVGFVQQAGESKRQVLLHGLAFTSGIYAWFGAVALAFIGVRLAGGELNWAFQFQNPWMVLGIGAVLVAFALNLFGVYEILLPTKVGAVAERAARADGLWGSFSHGIFATILATPCTAPFLGSALGFAVAQPSAVIPVIFLAIATGMALPYLLLSARPGWVRYLPRPGAWMVRVKEFMGFPLLATALWLVWLLGQMRGANAAVAALGFYLVIALAAWVYGAFLNPGAKPMARRLGALGLTALAGLVIWGWPVVGSTFAERPQAGRQASPETGRARDGVIQWEPFSNRRLAKILEEGSQPIFVNFTADWCWTCKVNEQVVLSRRDVIDAFERGGFAMLKADFTDFDPEIKARLEEFERGGVPMYVLYPSDRKRNPVLLPEVITPEIVIKAARRAGGG